MDAKRPDSESSEGNQNFQILDPGTALQEPLVEGNAPRSWDGVMQDPPPETWKVWLNATTGGSW